MSQTLDQPLLGRNGTSINNTEGRPNRQAPDETPPVPYLQDTRIEKVRGLTPNFETSLSFRFWSPFANIVGCFVCCQIGGVYRRVDRGDVGLSLNDGRPEILLPGWHSFWDPRRSFCGTQTVSGNVSWHTIHIVSIPEGHVGLVRDRGRFYLLEQGWHQWDSETMEFSNAIQDPTNGNVGIYNLSHPLLRIGPYTRLTVNTGEVAITMNDGHLEVKRHGIHWLMHQNHLFCTRLPLSERLDQINEAGGGANMPRRQTQYTQDEEAHQPLSAITRDLIPLRMGASVCYQISDPAVAYTNLGNMKAIQNHVHRQARQFVQYAAQNSFASNGISVIPRRDEQGHRVLAQASAPPADDLPDEGMNDNDPDHPHHHHHHQATAQEGTNMFITVEDEAKSFDDREAALQKCRDDLEQNGVHLVDIFCRDAEIADDSIKEALARKGIITTMSQEKRANAAADKEVAEMQAEAERNAEILKAEGRAEAIEKEQAARAKAIEQLYQKAKECGGETFARTMAETQYAGDALKNTESTVYITRQGEDESLAHSMATQGYHKK
eukprot:gb/GECH01012031.1/.p1 GENE.gb/GECH01012031.1/~~gb/GECH01012031.1/.p1  ORF type:complete len:551 (+),score=168.29 gb/GECH01012031.1/:1-1653(+)